MKVHEGLSSVPSIPQPVLTIGTFDGVHTAHQKIIERLREEARSVSGESVLLTFSPHPRHVLSPNPEEVPLLTTLAEKKALLDYFGLDRLVVAKFTREFSQQSPEQFVKNVLVEKIRPAKIVIGYDHRFGKDRAGDIHLLRELGPDFGFDVQEIPEQIVDNIAVSSTKVRTALQKGEVQKAYQQLNHYFTLHGTVVKGDQRGHLLGFPTANLEVDHPYKLIPADGVYAVKVNYEGQILDGVLNIGNRPTYDGKKQRVEVHIFDFEEKIYGEELGIYFIDRIREDRKFESEEALIKAMRDDKNKAQQILRADIELTP